MGRLLCRYVECIAKGRTSEALSALISLQPSLATLVELGPDGEITSREEIEVSLLGVALPLA